jgi:hypothetical protein
MKISSRLVGLAVVIAFIVVGAVKASAAPLLAVDFGRVISGSPTAVQPGFSGIAGAPVEGTRTENVGIYTVTVTGEGFYSSPTAIDPGVAALYQDYYYHNSPVNGVGVALSIGGVTANTDYDLTLWSYDGDQIFSATPTLWSPQAGSNTTGTSGSITNFAIPTPTSLAEYATTIRVKSTTTTLDIFGTTTAGGGGTRLNGFELNQVPEPSTMILAGIGIAMALAYRRSSVRRD